MNYYPFWFQILVIFCVFISFCDFSYEYAQQHFCPSGQIYEKSCHSGPYDDEYRVRLPPPRQRECGCKKYPAPCVDEIFRSYQHNRGGSDKAGHGGFEDAHHTFIYWAVPESGNHLEIQFLLIPNLSPIGLTF